MITELRTYELSATDIAPGEIRACVVALVPVPEALARDMIPGIAARPFRPLRIEATASTGIVVIDAYVAGEGKVLDETALEPVFLGAVVAEIGEIVTVYVRNDSSATRNFRAHLIGEDILGDDDEGPIAA